MQQVTTRHYLDLLKIIILPLIPVAGGNMTVSHEDNQKLIAPFSQDEIKKVVFSMEKNTAPGPDHLPVEFFQACWDIIKGELENMFTEF